MAPVIRATRTGCATSCEFSYRVFDADLTDRGIAQAEHLGEALRTAGHRYGLPVCSPLRWARQTAEIVFAQLRLPLEAELEDFYHRKLLIKPSQAAIKRLRERLAAETRTLRGGNAMAVIATLNPVIRGWMAYYRTVVSSEIFSSLDAYTWRLLYKWARWRHPNKPVRWVITRYFGKFSKFRNDYWVFGDRDSGAHLVRFSWTNIERHTPVKGAASPDDPALASYWADRRKKIRPPLDAYNLRLLSRQAGQCPLCGDQLLPAGQPPQSPEEWEQWWLHVTRRAIAASYLVHHGRPGPPRDDQTRLVHASCQRGLNAHQRRKPEPQLQP